MQHVHDQHVGLSTPFRLCDQVRECREEIQKIKTLTLEDELDHIFVLMASDRDKRIVSEYYGWRGVGGQTLETLSHKFSLSRERIRQICSKAIRRNSQGAYAPAIDKASTQVTARAGPGKSSRPAAAASRPLRASSHGDNP